MTRRRRAKPTGPEALAASLPDELKSFGGLDTPEDFQARLAAIAELVGSDEAMPVANAAGLSVVAFYKQRLSGGS